MKWFQIFEVCMAGVMMAGQLAREAEQVFSGPGQGEKKKEFVEQTLDVTAQTAKEMGAPGVTTDRAVTAAKSTLDAVVSIYNLVGAFRQPPVASR